MSNKHYLDISPISQPRVRKQIKGKKVDFFDIVRQADMKNVVTTHKNIRIYLHDEKEDFKVPFPGYTVYCLSKYLLPLDEPMKSREIMRKLAYAYHDWAAREIVARYHRDVRRESLLRK